LKLGLQRKDISELEAELSLPSSQVGRNILPRLVANEAALHCTASWYLPSYCITNSSDFLSIQVFLFLGWPEQVLALFSKSMRKLYGHLRAVKEAAVERTLPKVRLN